MQPNTNPVIPESAGAMLLALLNERGWVRIGCGAPAVGFARYAEAHGASVSVAPDPEHPHMMRISKED